jgi:hypothetical protein
MPTPNHPALPLCSQLATQPQRQLFAFWLDALLTDPAREFRRNAELILKGMLCGYTELGLIDNDQRRAMSDELTAYGAAV